MRVLLSTEKVRKVDGGLTQRARGRLDSHRQNGFIVALGFIRFVGKSRPFQPPVTQTVGQFRAKDNQ
jgi:hypothetical protein